MSKYPLKYHDFLDAIKVGNYTCFYALLDDRIHFEMTAENITFCTQKFYESIDEEMNLQGDNYTGNRVTFYVKRTLNGITKFRYYPTESQINEMKEIELYEKLIVQEMDESIPEQEHDEIKETDTHIKTYKDGKLVLILEKQ